jgi:hypothetical protein
VPATPGEVLGGCLLLLIALLPTGLALLRVAERLLVYRFRLTVPERLLLAFYAAGAVIFVVASVPVPIYGTPLMLAVLGLGVAGYGLFALLERGSGLRAAGMFVLSPVGIVLGVGTLGLLVFEVLPIWNHPFPNAWDGSATALWMNLTFRNGTLPTSLQPFASAPVLYPLATTVWMTLPVRLLGWPLVQAPVLLPPLFLSFTVPSAYCWGARWGARSPAAGTSVGLLFATFFGLVASWPRFFTGGSYDFAFALPLFLVALGFLPTFVRSERIAGSQLLGFGLLAGVVASLSLAAGEALLVLLLAYAIVACRGSVRTFVAWLGRTAFVAVFEVAFTLRSVIAWVAYGQPAVPSASTLGSLNLRLVEGELDPFVPSKPKMSPFPWISLELQILLVAGLVLAGWALWATAAATRRTSLSQLAADLVVGTAALFLLTGVLLLSALPGPEASDLQSITNLDESSILLFIFFGALSAFPLVMALSWLTERRAVVARAGPDPSRHRPAFSLGGKRSRESGGYRAVVETLAVLVLLIPLSAGTAFSLVEGPGFIQANVGKTSNVTAGDLAAMDWVGANLPSCSAVLVAPGSAGQFLPEYSVVHLVFPMNPVPRNQSYAVVVSNLTAGEYSSITRSALENLGITEVFVTGQTSVSYEAFSAGPLKSSSDFVLLDQSGDAFVFGFLPGESATGCVA